MAIEQSVWRRGRLTISFTSLKIIRQSRVLALQVLLLGPNKNLAINDLTFICLLTQQTQNQGRIPDRAAMIKDVRRWIAEKQQHKFRLRHLSHSSADTQTYNKQAGTQQTQKYQAMLKSQKEVKIQKSETAAKCDSRIIVSLQHCRLTWGGFLSCGIRI